MYGKGRPSRSINLDNKLDTSSTSNSNSSDRKNSYKSGEDVPPPFAKKSNTRLFDWGSKISITLAWSVGALICTVFLVIVIPAKLDISSNRDNITHLSNKVDSINKKLDFSHDRSLKNETKLNGLTEYTKEVKESINSHVLDKTSHE